MKKNILITALGCVIVILVIIMLRANVTTPVIGFYQVTDVGSDNMVQLVLDRNNNYTVYLNSKVFDEGTYIRSSTNAYILNHDNESPSSFIISKKLNYLFIPGIDATSIFEMEKISDVPSYTVQ